MSGTEFISAPGGSGAVDGSIDGADLAPNAFTAIAASSALSATYVQKGALVLLASDYANLAAALAAATAGQTVLVSGSVASAGISVPADVTLAGLANVTLTATSGTYAVNLSHRSRLVGITIDCQGASRGVGIATGIQDAVVEDIIVKNATDAGFRCEGAVRPVLRNCSTTNCKYGVLLNTGTSDGLVSGGYHTGATCNTSFEGAVYIPNAIRCRIVNVSTTANAGHGIWVGGSSTSDISFNGCTSQGNGTAGNDHRGATIDSSCSHISFENCRFLGNIENGVIATATTTYINFTNCLSRGNNVGNRPGGHGFELLSQYTQATGCWSVGQLGNTLNSGGGFYLGAAGASLTGCYAELNYGHGIRAFEAKNTIITGCRSRANSQSGAGQHNGIDVGATSGGNHVTVIGSRAWDDQGTPTQGTGLSLYGPMTSVLLGGNDYYGNTVAQYSDTTSGTQTTFDVASHLTIRKNNRFVQATNTGGSVVNLVGLNSANVATVVSGTGGFAVLNAAQSTNMLTVGANGSLQYLRTTQTLAANGAVAMDGSTGPYQEITLAANATSSSISNASAGRVMTITWIQDGTGGRTYVWPTSCKFAGGSAPADTTASKRTSVTFMCDGTNWNEISRSVAVG